MGKEDRRLDLFALLGLDFTQVELELLALENVSVGTATLSGSGGNGSQHTTGHELVQEGLLNLGILLPLRVLLSGLAGPLGVEDLLISLAKLGSLLATKREGIVRLVPLTEGSGINDDDGVLDEGLGPDQLIVARVVHNVDDTGLPGDSLATPGEISLVEPESSELLTSTSDPDGMDALGAQLGHGGGASHLELPLFPDWASLASGGTSLMPMVS